VPADARVVPAEAAVEEARVIVAQLADADVDREHLRREVGRHADALAAREEREPAGVEDAVAAARVHRLPEVEPVVDALRGEARPRPAFKAARQPQGSRPTRPMRQQQRPVVVEAHLERSRGSAPMKHSGRGRVALPQLGRGQGRAPRWSRSWHRRSPRLSRTGNERRATSTHSGPA
jgi:hypothetical protein